MKYTITRYEEKSDALFICLTSDHCTMEHFFTPEEMLDRKGTIEHLLAHLEVMEDDYVEPEQFVDKLPEVEKMVLDTARIATDKAAILVSRATVPGPIEKPMEELVGE